MAFLDGNNFVNILSIDKNLSFCVLGGSVSMNMGQKPGYSAYFFLYGASKTTFLQFGQGGDWGGTLTPVS